MSRLAPLGTAFRLPYNCTRRISIYQNRLSLLLLLFNLLPGFRCFVAFARGRWRILYRKSRNFHPCRIVMTSLGWGTYFEFPSFHRTITQ